MQSSAVDKRAARASRVDDSTFEWFVDHSLRNVTLPLIPDTEIIDPLEPTFPAKLECPTLFIVTFGAAAFTSPLIPLTFRLALRSLSSLSSTLPLMPLTCIPRSLRRLTAIDRTPLMPEISE